MPRGVSLNFLIHWSREWLNHNYSPDLHFTRAIVTTVASFRHSFSGERATTWSQVHALTTHFSFGLELQCEIGWGQCCSPCLISVLFTCLLSTGTLLPCLSDMGIQDTLQGERAELTTMCVLLYRLEWLTSALYKGSHAPPQHCCRRGFHVFATRSLLPFM